MSSPDRSTSWRPDGPLAPRRRPDRWSSSRGGSTGSRSLDLVRHTVELAGVTGVKLYPPSGFVPIGNVFRFGERVGAPLDAALTALYRYCEETGVPILTHASHSNGFDKGYDDLGAPSGWEQVLREYGGLRLASGTSVTSTGWRRESRRLAPTAGRCGTRA